MKTAKEGYIALEIVISREGDQYSAWCPELDVASCGATPEEAMENVRDAIELYLDTLKEEGELADLLKKRGIKVTDSNEPVMPSSFITQYRQKVLV